MDSIEIQIVYLHNEIFGQFVGNRRYRRTDKFPSCSRRHRWNRCRLFGNIRQYLQDINQFDLYVNPNETLVNFTFARASIGSQFVTGWAFAPETTCSVDAFTTAAQSRCALTLVNI